MLFPSGKPHSYMISYLGTMKTKRYGKARGDSIYMDSNGPLSIGESKAGRVQVRSRSTRRRTEGGDQPLAKEYHAVTIFWVGDLNSGTGFAHRAKSKDPSPHLQSGLVSGRRFEPLGIHRDHLGTGSFDDLEVELIYEGDLGIGQWSVGGTSNRADVAVTDRSPLIHRGTFR
jgi:hypothetical protein